MRRALLFIAGLGLVAGCQGTKSISVASSAATTTPATTSTAAPATPPAVAAAEASLAAVASAAEAKVSSLEAQLASKAAPAAPSASAAAPPAPSASAAAPSADASAATGLKIFKPGYVATVTDSGSPILHVSVKLLKVTQKAPDEFVGKPKFGYYVTVTVSAKALAKDQDINPFDFYVKAKDGSHSDESSGNGALASIGNRLDSATLNNGEIISGTITFDVPTPHILVVYAPGEQALGGWQF